MPGDNVAAGWVVGIIGFVFLVTSPMTMFVGLFIGIALIVWGSNMSQAKKCSECATKVNKSAKLCPACKCEFADFSGTEAGTNQTTP